jgi:hypothetical protein
MPKNFKHRDFLDCPFLGAEMKKNIYDFPKQAKFPKFAPNFSKHLFKIKFHEYFRA